MLLHIYIFGHAYANTSAKNPKLYPMFEFPTKLGTFNIQMDIYCYLHFNTIFKNVKSNIEGMFFELEHQITAT